ncbi:MAG: diacylglycerol kinase [Bauldia sp.]|nr:diacylglycerol kinase [Bauldia sp.]
MLGFELVNSAIEYLTDELHPTVSPKIKLVKDAAAAAVLVASFGSLIMRRL